MATLLSKKLIRVTLASNIRLYSSSNTGGNQGLLSKLVDNIRQRLEKHQDVEGAVSNIKIRNKKTLNPDQKAQGNVAESDNTNVSKKKIETNTGNIQDTVKTTKEQSYFPKKAKEVTEKLDGRHSQLGEVFDSNPDNGNRKGLTVDDLKSRNSSVVLREQSESVTIIDEYAKKDYSKDDPEYEDLPPEEERHKDWQENEKKKLNKKAMVPLNFFRDIKDKNKDNFFIAVDIFCDRDVRLRGHVEFIYSALKEMKTFGIHRDLEAYKKIIHVLPKGRMIASNRLQVEFMHYPKQQQCAIDILEQMEQYGVMPDSEVHTMLTNVFGSLSFPMRKVMRMQYWMPKFKNLSPWPIPSPPPDDSLELAKLAIQRITSVDIKTKITIYDAGDLEDAIDHTWIVSGQSSDQQELIEKHSPDRPIYVEGAFRIWLGLTCINYFILRAEPPKLVRAKDSDASKDDVSQLEMMFQEDYVEKVVATVPTVHEQDDGNILAVCATGSSSRDSVVSWIRFLEESNPRLGKDISVLFTLRSPIGTTDDLEILSEQESAKQLQISEGQGTIGTGLGLNPSKPDLRNVGVWSQSDSKFVNWPHHPEHKESKLHLQMRDKKTQVTDGSVEGSANVSKDQICSTDKSSKTFSNKV